MLSELEIQTLKENWTGFVSVTAYGIGNQRTPEMIVMLARNIVFYEENESNKRFGGTWYCFRSTESPSKVRKIKTIQESVYKDLSDFLHVPNYIHLHIEKRKTLLTHYLATYNLSHIRLYNLDE